MAKAEKTGYTLSGGADGEGVVLSIAFAFPSATDALDFEKSMEAPAAAKGGKGKKEKAAEPSKGRKSKKDEDEEDDDEDDEDEEDEDEDEDDEEEDEDDEDDADEDEDDEEDEDEKPKKGAKDKGAKGKKDDADAGGKPTVKVTKELKEATRLRDVIAILMGQGLKGAQLVSACKKLQGTLPVLKSIKDLETRVPRAASLVKAK